MPPNEEVSRSLIQVAIDKAEQSKLLRGLVEIRTSLTDLGKTADKELDKRFAAGVPKARKEIQKLNEELKRTKTTLEDFPDELPLPGSGRGGSRLTTLGREARLQLPATPIGGGLSSEQLARAVEGLGRIDDALGNLSQKSKLAAAALGVSVVGTIALVAALASLKKQNDEAKRSAEATLGQAKTYFQLIQTGTAESIQSGLDDAQARERAARANLIFQKQVLLGLEQAINAGGEFNAIMADAGVTMNSLLGTQPELSAAREAVAAAEKEFAEATSAVNAHAMALQSDEVAIRSAIEAQQELAEERRKLNDRLINTQIGALSQISSATVEGVDDRVKALQDEKAAIEEFLSAGNGSPELLKELRARLAEIGTEVSTLAYRIRPVAEVNDRLKFEAKQQEELVERVKDFENERTKIVEDANEQRIRLDESYADKVIDITTKYTNDVDKALLKLQEAGQDLGRNVDRDVAKSEREARFDRLNDQIKFNEETAKQARDLERELNKIRDDSANQREDLIRNRDFAGLRRLNNERNRALDQAVDNFNVEQREREIAFKQQQQLTNRQLEFEAEERRIRFEQQIEDARIQYDREKTIAAQEQDRQLKALEDSKQRELRAVATAEQKKLNLLADVTRKELEFISKSEAQRLAIRQQADQIYLETARQILLGGLGGLAGSTSNTLNSAQTFNITAGGSPAQQQGLVNLIQQVTLQTLRGFFN